MKSLTPKETRALRPVCPPGLLPLYALAAGLVVTLIALGVPAREVALLLAAATISVIAATNPAMAATLAQSARNVLARIAAPAVTS